MAGGDRKYGNNKEVCKQYKAEAREEKNRKRAMRRHLRNNPNDVEGRKRFEQTYGRADFGLSCHGKHKKKRAEKLARAA